MLNSLRNIYKLLDRKDRGKVMIIVVLMVIAAFAQTAGIASVMPFLAVLGDPQIIERNIWLKELYAFLGFSSADQFLFFLGLFAFIVFVIGTALQALNQWVITRFGSMQQYHLSRRLMNDYLSRPYTFFLTRNSSDLSKTVLQETNQAVSGALLPAMRLVSFFLLATAIVALLIYAEPRLAVAVALVLFLVYGTIFILARRWLARMGEDRVVANRERFTAVAEAFAGAKEIRLLAREYDYLERYREPTRRIAVAQANALLIEQMPQHAIEAIAFGGVLLVTLFLMEQGGLAHALPLIGLYALAGKQLIPAFQRIFATIANIRFNMPVVEAVLADLGPRLGSLGVQKPLGRNDRLSPTRAITLENVTFRYEGADYPALDKIDLTIPANSTVGIVGSSGSGKSTLIDVLLGLLPADDGRLMIDDIEVGPNTIRSWQAAIGYVPQQIFLADASIVANIALGVPHGEVNIAAVENAAKLANLHDFVTKDLPQGYETLVGERGVRLSGGQRQRIGIARALYRDPDVLLFDEATSALDNTTERVVMEAIHRLSGSRTILLVAHRLTTVRPAGQILVLDRGKIVEQGNWEQLSATGKHFRKLLAAQ